MSTLKTIIIALGLAAAANQIIPPLAPTSVKSDCGAVIECPKQEID